VTAAGAGVGRPIDPSVALARIEEFLRREQAAAQRDHLATLMLSPAERVARGRAIGPIRYLGEQGGDWVFGLAADDSRFRDGDGCLLGPAAIGDAVERGARVRYVRFDQAAGRLQLRPDRGVGTSWPPTGELFVDAQRVDLTSLYLAAARGALGGGEVTDLVRALVLGGLSRQNTTRAAQLERLVRGMRGLNGSQVSAFTLLEAAPLALIQGPPGTGKTHLLAKMVAYLLAAGQRVLLCAVAHRAVNHALNACADASPGAGVLKLGDPEQADHLAPSVVQVEQARDVGRQAGPGVGLLAGTSVAKVPGLVRAAGAFDLVVIDEAGQLTTPQALCAAIGAPRALLFGDHRQLGPVRSTDPVGGWSADGWDPGGSIFEQLAGKHPTELLTVTHRLNRELASFPSAAFYDRRLRASRATAGARLMVRPEAGDVLAPILEPEAPLVWVEVEHRLRTPPVPEEADLAVACVARALRSGLSPESVGVISPYRAQNGAIRSRLRSLVADGLAGADRVVVDTVERMQGQEREMIVVSLAISDTIALEAQAEFVYLPNRLNVAVTRARTKCVVLGSPALREHLSSTAATLHGWTTLARLRACARRVRAQVRPDGGFDIAVLGEPDP